MSTYAAQWAAAREKAAFLALADGTIFRGISCGAPVDQPGEVVFNTAMTGDEEILSDPSSAGQLIVLTVPETGNTGFNQDDLESRNLHAAGLIVLSMNEPSNWRATESLQSALIRHGIPAIAGVDTRALTLKLRDGGTQNGFLCCTGSVTPEEAIQRARDWEGLGGQDYASRVSTPEPYVWGDLADSAPLVAVLDFGATFSTLRMLVGSGLRPLVLPAKTTVAEVLAHSPAGILLSSGPANPAALPYAAETIRGILGKIPIMGLGLGHQLLGIALGGKAKRLKSGHHGGNHPVLDIKTGTVEITTQHHSYVLDGASLPAAAAKVTHRSLNDHTIEGIEALQVPAFSLQYLPSTAAFTSFRSLIG